MSTLHLFNPSHDEALAANSPYYYPTKAARLLADDLSVLPAWWAKEGDFVLIPQNVDLPPTDFCPNSVRFIHPSDLKKRVAKDITSIFPWGWDPLLIHQLQQAGVSDTLLPDEEKMKTIRQLSSRETSVKLLQAVRKELPDSIGESFYIRNEKEVWDIAHTYGKVMLKAPWSCSGRGVFPAQADAPENTRKRVVRILKDQGAIEVEPLYERVSDFALEFFAETDTVHYIGLSVFATTDIGAYTGNIVADGATLLSHLPERIRKDIPQVIRSLTHHLQLLLSHHYQGPLGVDLMCVRKPDDQLAIHPCVEINLRNTMGHVALSCKSLLSDNQTGIYRLQPIVGNDRETLRLTPFSHQIEAVLISDSIRQ